MRTIEGIKNFDDWDYYRLVVRFRWRGVLYHKCAIANEPVSYRNYHAVLLIADDLTTAVMPHAGYVFLTVGNLEKVTLKNIVFGKD
jgi:hypothetical protein